MEAKIVVTCKVCGKVINRTPKLTSDGVNKILTNVVNKREYAYCDKHTLKAR